VRALRTLVSALVILAGAALVVTWVFAWASLRAVEDGAIARTLTRAALASPAVTEHIGTVVQQQASASLAERGVDLGAVGFDDELAAIITSLARSDEFEDLVLDQVDAVHAVVKDELAREDRPPGPLVVSVDVDTAVNARLGELPLVGPSLPDVALEPVPIELMSADSFEKARTGYERLEFARAYFLWAGLALIAIGLLVSTRRRYVIAKFLLAAGAMALVAAAVLTVIPASTLANALPGAGDGPFADLVGEAVGKRAIGGVTRTLFLGGIGAIAAAGVAGLLGRLGRERAR